MLNYALGADWNIILHFPNRWLQSIVEKYAHQKIGLKFIGLESLR